jgi:hypothetical protein
MTDQRTLKNIINQQREQIKELEADRDGAEALSHTIQEERNKLEIELNFYKTANRELIDFKRQIMTEVHTPLAKIAEANRILKDLIIQFDFGGAREDQLILVKDLRKVLALNKPKEMASPDTESEPKKTIGKEAILNTSWTKPLKGAEAGLRLDSDSSLTCDKSKEPPCHLEPSIELCKKCSLNSGKETGSTKP